MHDASIVHKDIKPKNILVLVEENGEEVFVLCGNK